MKKLEKSVRSRLWPYAHDLHKRWVLQGFTGQLPCWGCQTLRCAYADIDVEHGVCTGISIYGMEDAWRRNHYEHTIDFVDITEEVKQYKLEYEFGYQDLVQAVVDKIETYLKSASEDGNE